MKKKKQSLTLAQVVKACHKAGMKISFGLEDKQMPSRFKDDPEPVKLLIDESERVTALGNKWLTANVPNPIAAEQCFRQGWAYSLAAAWLRCKLRGEFTTKAKPEQPEKS